MSKERSPFTPGRPVPIDYFRGRLDEIRRLERALKQASMGGNENIFLTGERGIGKSSLADFICFLAEKDYQFIQAHSYLGATKSVDELCQVVFQDVVRHLPEKKLMEKVRDGFSKYIKRIDFGLFGVNVGVELTRDAQALKDIRLNFPILLHELFQTLKDDRKGILIVLDDLNGITGNPDFAFFVKSLVDSLASGHQSLPLVILLVGIDQRMRDLASSQPSVTRIFHTVELSTMSDSEAHQFFRKAFDSVSCKLEPDALDHLVYSSGGLPMLMHEVGDAVFWLDKDNNINLQDALDGIFLAADMVGRKYLDPTVYSAIRSKAYLSILRRIGRMPLSFEFKRGDILREIPSPETKKFDAFVRKMLELGMVKHGTERGMYVFANNLYRLYITLEAIRAENKTRE